MARFEPIPLGCAEYVPSRPLVGSEVNKVSPRGVCPPLQPTGEAWAYGPVVVPVTIIINIIMGEAWVLVAMSGPHAHQHHHHQKTPLFSKQRHP